MDTNKNISEGGQSIYLSVKGVSDYLAIKEKTIYKLVETGQIPHYRIGKLVRFKLEEVAVWMQSKKSVPPEKQVDKIVSSFYSKHQGRPSRLGKEV